MNYPMQINGNVTGYCGACQQKVGESHLCPGPPGVTIVMPPASERSTASAEAISGYLRTSIELYLGDPPDSDYQRGHLLATVEIYEQAGGDEELIRKARALTEEA
jgi:hypothetical protein